MSPKNVTDITGTKRFSAGTRRVPLRDHFEDIFSPLDLANGWTVFRSEKCVGTGFDRADPTHVSDQKTDEPFKRYKRNKILKRTVGISHPTVWFSQQQQKKSNNTKKRCAAPRFQEENCCRLQYLFYWKPFNLVAIRKVLTNTLDTKTHKNSWCVSPSSF